MYNADIMPMVGNMQSTQAGFDTCQHNYFWYWEEVQVGQTVISNTHVQTSASILLGFSVLGFKTVKVVFCDNLLSAAPSVRGTESAARLCNYHDPQRVVYVVTCLTLL